MDDVKQAIQVLLGGGIVIFPTDTAFGIGCRIDSEKAIKRLFTLRRRPFTQAPPILAASLNMLQPYLESVPENIIEQLIKPYWPGALTIVLKCKTQNVPEMARNGDTMGVRVPNHLTTLDLINGVGVPLLGPSANFHGEKSPFLFDELDQELVSLVDYVVPGTCTVKNVSTVIDCTQDPWKILRQGAITVSL